MDFFAAIWGGGAPYEESSSNCYCTAFSIGFFLQRTTIVCTPWTILRSMRRWVEERQVDERKFRILNPDHIALFTNNYERAS